MSSDELTSSVIGAAHKVLYTLKPGLDEKLYERALVIELSKRNLCCENQRSFKVYYEAQLIGSFKPDLIIENKVIVEVKLVTAFNENHIAQLLGYLKITGLQLGLLLNFKNTRLGIKRISM